MIDEKTIVPERWEDIHSFFNDKDTSSWLFRGQCNSSWGIESSLARTAKRLGVALPDIEPRLIRDFKRGAHNYYSRLPDKESTFEWLAFMQHAGVPTRLIDFTKSFWVALYFALDGSFFEQDAAIYCLNLSYNKESYLKQRFVELGVDENLILGVLAKDEDIIIKHKKHYENNQERRAGISINEGYFVHERLVNQKGVLAYQFDLEKSFIENLSDEGLNAELIKVIIPAHLFNVAFKKLHQTNCNAKLLYGGVEGFCKGLPYKLFE